MNRLIAITMAVFLMLGSASAISYAAERYSGGAPPVEQPLVREGDFAVAIARGLNLTDTREEAKAESTLASIGIAPRNGWIADYPVTPDIIAEVQGSVAKAADEGKLAMNREKAVETVRNVSTEMGLPIMIAGDSYKIPPQENYYGSEKIPPQDRNYGPEYWLYNEGNWDYAYNEDYYYDYGPPVVTYYPPPWDYGYMYSYVPFPFWWGGIGFGGYYVLNDFNRTVVTNGTPVTVTNQVAVADGRVSRINPATRAAATTGAVAAGATGGAVAAARPPTRPGATAGAVGAAPSRTSRTPGLSTADAQQGARSILNNSIQRGPRTGASARDADRLPGTSLGAGSNTGRTAGCP